MQGYHEGVIGRWGFIRQSPEQLARFLHPQTIRDSVLRTGSMPILPLPLTLDTPRGEGQSASTHRDASCVGDMLSSVNVWPQAMTIITASRLRAILLAPILVPGDSHSLIPRSHMANAVPAACA